VGKGLWVGGRHSRVLLRANKAAHGERLEYWLESKGSVGHSLTRGEWGKGKKSIRDKFLGAISDLAHKLRGAVGPEEGSRYQRKKRVA